MQPFTHGYALLIGLGMCRSAARWWGRRRGRRHGYTLLSCVGMCQCAPWSLPTRVKDVQALHAALVDPAACAYPDDADHGRVLHDAAATHDAILEGVLAYSWTREQDTSLGVEAELLIGAKSESSAGIGVMTSVEEIKTGFGGRASFAYHWQNASTIAASHSLMSSDRLELRGSQEPEAHFPHLGQLARKA